MKVTLSIPTAETHSQNINKKKNSKYVYNCEEGEDNQLNLKITYEKLEDTLGQTPDYSPGHDN